MMDGRFKIKQFSVDGLEAACQQGPFFAEKAGAMVSVQKVYRHPDAYLDIRLLGLGDINELNKSFRRVVLRQRQFRGNGRQKPCQAGLRTVS